MHFDAPWFWGADRMNLPVWLLVTMHRSGLFRSEAVAQIQGVAYVHDWGREVNLRLALALYYPHFHVCIGKAANMTDVDLNAHFGGGFFHHTAGERVPARLFAPRAGSAILLDGSQCAHGTELYRAGDKHLELPMTDKSDQRALEYVPASKGKTEQWQLRVNGKVIHEYAMSDLRIALVWRSKCFTDHQELAKYKKAPRLKVGQSL
jgi:hypothetical protein